MKLTNQMFKKLTLSLLICFTILVPDKIFASNPMNLMALDPDTGFFKMKSKLFNPSSILMKGFSTGGGGNAVVCYNDDNMITSIELYDYYESLIKDKSKNKMIYLKGSTLEEKIKSAFSRMEKRYPDLGRELKNRALAVYSRIDQYMLTSDEAILTPVYDMNVSFYPNKNNKDQKCPIVRFAVNDPSAIDGQNEFFFVKDLFYNELTSPNTRAGIIMHEVLYEHARKNGAKNSEFVRWFNYLISTKKFETMGADDFKRLESHPDAKFLLGPSMDKAGVFIEEANEAYLDFSIRDDVLFLEEYNIQTKKNKMPVSCREVGACQLYVGEYVNLTPNSTRFLPKFVVTSKLNSFAVPYASVKSGSKHLSKEKGQNWEGEAEIVANLTPRVCHVDSNKACNGDFVTVEFKHRRGISSFRGIVAGIFKYGDLAVQVTDGKFFLDGMDIDPFVLNKSKKAVYIYVSRQHVKSIN
jgi:hypothetical protein